MKKLIFIISALMCFAFTMEAQDFQDVVYLKNGQVIRGSIVKPLDENGVKIMNSNSDVLSFSADQVRKVAREKMLHQNQKNVVHAYQPKGFTNITTLGYGFGVGSYEIMDNTVDNELSYFSIHTINGYHLNDLLSLGLGIGVEFHEEVGEGQDGYELVPLFADIRFTPTRKEMAPFFYADAGYGLGAFEPDVKGGAMFGLGGGLQWSLNRNSALVASFGYRYQAHGFDNSGSDFNANYLNFKLGFKF